MIKIYNTLSKNKETFKPIQKGQVNMYVCGMTVYDFCHIGHARVMVIFDVIRRWFDISGYSVNYVRNITDIDDKIINRSIQNNESIESLTQRYINEMHADAKALGVQSPSREPKATEHIKDMLSMIQTLIEKQHAYLAKNGDIFYISDTNKEDGFKFVDVGNYYTMPNGKKCVITSFDLANKYKHYINFPIYTIKEARNDNTN